MGALTMEQVQGSASGGDVGGRAVGGGWGGRRSLGVAGTCPSCLLAAPLQVPWLEEKSVGAVAAAMGPQPGHLLSL